MQKQFAEIRDDPACQDKDAMGVGKRWTGVKGLRLSVAGLHCSPSPF